MLIEFSIANFRSFKEKQTFSMVADKPHQALRHVFESGFNAAPRILETCALFGPNGSGKSNIILALRFVRDFVVHSSLDRQREQPIDDIEPFAFSASSSAAPSEFEMVFIHKDFLFQYGFSVDAKRVHKEYLYATPKGGKKQSAQRWFERDVDDPKKSYIRKELKGQKQSWLEATRSNALFLSTAVQYNSKDFFIPFEWIGIKLRLVQNPMLFPNAYSIECLDSASPKRERIIKFMKGLDFAFDDLQVINVEIPDQEFNAKTSQLPDDVKAKLSKNVNVLLSKYLDTEGNAYALTFDQESHGTQRLFAFSGPILDVLDNGLTLVVDEIDSALHPLALRGIVSLFNNPKTNRYNAQLIFSTHNTTPMSILDRDQIVLVDKDDSHATMLSYVSDFEGRADEAVERRYFSGRYGALPNMGEIF